MASSAGHGGPALQLNAKTLGGRIHRDPSSSISPPLIRSFSRSRLLAFLSGVAQAIGPRRSLLHLSWLGFGVSHCFFAFWAMWGYQEVDWTLTSFLGLLTVPALIYVFSSIVVPPDPSTIESWHDYFFEIRSSLFAAGALAFVAIILSNQLIQGTSPTHPLEFTLYATVVAFAIGLVSDSVRVHAALAFWPPLSFVLILLQLDQAAATVSVAAAQQAVGADPPTAPAKRVSVQSVSPSRSVTSSRELLAAQRRIRWAALYERFLAP